MKRAVLTGAVLLGMVLPLAPSRLAPARVRRGDPAPMKRLGKTYETHVMEGAGHGFLKGQSQSAANAKAAADAWPLTIAFLKKQTQ